MTVPSADGSISETNDGFIVGVDPKQPPLTTEQLAALQESEVANSQQPVQLVEQQPVQDPRERFFTAEDLNRVRQEEKDKLYNRLTETQEQLKAIQQEQDRRLEEERLAREAAEAERKKKEEDAMEVRDLLERREQEFNSRISEIESRMEQERAVFEMEKQFMEIQRYRQEAIEAHSEYIMPELRDLVTGNSIEEIDASIDAMKSRTAAIMQSVQQAQLDVRQAMRGTAPTAPPVGPMEQESTFESLTPDQIRNMDPATYAKNRARLLNAASQNYRAGG